MWGRRMPVKFGNDISTVVVFENGRPYRILVNIFLKKSIQVFHAGATI